MTDVLMFIEDPGVANFMVPVIPALQELGLSVALRVTGTAVAYIGQNSAVKGTAPEGNAAAVLDAVAPRLVFTGTSEDPRSLGLELIAAGRARGLPTVAAIDAPTNVTERFRGLGSTPLAFAPDHILMPDEDTAHAYVGLGHPRARLTVCGHPHYDAAMDRLVALRKEGRDQVRARVLKGNVSGPVVVFAAEISEGLLPEEYKRSPEYTLGASGRYHTRTEIVIEEFLIAAAAMNPRPYTVLRLHPKNTREELAPFLDAFDEVSQGGPGLDVVFAADAVCGMISVLLAEAAVAKRPVLSILPRRKERDWLPTLIKDKVRVAQTPTELQTALSALVAGTGPLPVTILPGAAARAAAAIKGLLA